jgi:hypothetical protein
MPTKATINKVKTAELARRILASDLGTGRSLAIRHFCRITSAGTTEAGNDTYFLPSGRRTEKRASAAKAWAKYQPKTA